MQDRSFTLLVPILLLPWAVAGTESKSQPPTFTILAIGDTGEANLDLFRNALGINKATNDQSEQRRSALFFLGDNFYKHGLADEAERSQDRRFRENYGRWFESSFTALGMELGKRDPNKPVKRDGPGEPRVHAVAGNHDYYSKEASKQILSALPLGFTTEGNQYEALRKEWAYHCGDPIDAYWDLMDEEGQATVENGEAAAYSAEGERRFRDRDR